VFTARYGLIPYMKHVMFRLLKVKMVDDDNYLVMPRTINDVTLSVHTPLYICVYFAGNIPCPAGNKTSLVLSRDGRVYFY
jgi:hypothetical protein